MVKGHAAKHKISLLCCADGSVTTKESRINAEILGFYENLLGVADPPSSSCTVEMLRSILPLQLSDDMHSSLIDDVLKEDILAVIKSMPSNKAPGPDGYSVEFFRAA